MLNFSAIESGDASTNGQSLGGGSVGIPYASFLLGAINNATVNAPQDPQWRGNRWGMYLQDSWKVTRRLTLDYGIRWDEENEGHEIHQRNSMFGPTIPNPSAGGLLGGEVYEGYGPGRCNCQFAKPYPYAIGPRFGFAYQIDPKTVIRGGWGVVYANLATFSYFTNAAILGVGVNQLSFTSGTYGLPGATLSGGLQYNPAALYKVTLDPGVRPDPGQVDSPNYYLDPNANRPGRIHTFSVNLQRRDHPGLRRRSRLRRESWRRGKSAPPVSKASTRFQRGPRGARADPRQSHQRFAADFADRISGGEGGGIHAALRRRSRSTRPSRRAFGPIRSSAAR